MKYKQLNIIEFINEVLQKSVKNELCNNSNKVFPTSNEAPTTFTNKTSLNMDVSQDMSNTVKIHSKTEGGINASLKENISPLVMNQNSNRKAKSISKTEVIHIFKRFNKAFQKLPLEEDEHLGKLYFSFN